MLILGYLPHIILKLMVKQKVSTRHLNNICAATVLTSGMIGLTYFHLLSMHTILLLNNHPRFPHSMSTMDLNLMLFGHYPGEILKILTCPAKSSTQNGKQLAK
jgi:hypothetical protein